MDSLRLNDEARLVTDNACNSAHAFEEGPRLVGLRRSLASLSGQRLRAAACYLIQKSAPSESA